MACKCKQKIVKQERPHKEGENGEALYGMEENG